MSVTAEIVLLELPDFICSMKSMADVKQWRIPTDSALQSIFESFPKQAASKKPFVDAADFYEAVDRLIESTERTVPSDIKSFYGQVRREKVKAIADAESKVDLPEPVNTRNLRNARGGEEYVRFKRFHRQLMAARQEGKKFFLQDEYDERWNAPLTDEDWRLASNTNPAEAIAGSLGVPVPRADPKEADLVWA